MGWIIGAPSKRRIKGSLSVTSTAFPINNAANVAVKKPLNSTPCSSRIRRLVHKIRLKPTKKKIVGGRTCFTWAGHQSTARRRTGAGVGAARAGWFITLLRKDDAEPSSNHHAAPAQLGWPTHE